VASPSNWLIFALLTSASLVPAQTLQQAEALWKTRKYDDANEVFKVLVAKEPKNALYRVRWGEMYLEHWQPDVANQLFDEALGIDPQDAEALLGKARCAAESYGGNAAELARHAISIDPKLVAAQELLARLALEDDNKAKAAEEAHKALEIDPNSVQAKAILATIDWLADKKETPWDPHAAPGYETAGHFFMLNRRYEESVAFYRKALALDPDLYSARSKLGIGLMQLGQTEEAYQQLSTCAKNGFADPATVNSLNLMETFKNYVTYRTPETILKLNKKEAELLHPYFEEEMLRAIHTYEKKYRFKLTQPVQVEVYPNHEDFAVRTMGMPGLGALGVTFDYGIVMDSPSARPPGTNHWASTLWHEMSHVFTLNMTKSHVPRWFTEGMAVHEETAASPEWGDRLGPHELMAIRDHKLLPITELDRGFIHPVNPTQIVVSYYQGGRICDYINDKWGWDTLLAMLRDFGQDEDTATVVRKELKMEPAEFDKEFFAKVEEENKKTITNLPRWEAAVKNMAKLAEMKNNDAIIQYGKEWEDVYPSYVEMGSIYEYMADAYRAKGDTKDAVDQLEQYVHRGGRNPTSFKALATDLVSLGKKQEAAEILNRLNYIYPMDNDLHQRLGDLWLALGNTQGAVQEFRALVAHNPIDPAQAHFDLARAYNENHQPGPAKDEVLTALETAPGFRPAKRLLLELSK
jgi:tetratricopeptide (TPR) repeat protein